MNAGQFSDCFPLGSHLCREPMPPMHELKRDMELLKNNGFNLVKLQEHWMIDEPTEGEYDFGRCEELIDCAARLDMGVYLGLTCEQAPHWLYEKHPGCRMVMRDGTRVVAEAPTTTPSDGKPGPCFDHAGAMEDMLRFIRRLVSDLGAHENLVVWNTWQEVHYWTDGLLGQDVCYCENTLAAFRQRLRKRYGDLDALNRAWNVRYGAWNDIQPERRRSRYPIAVEMAFRRFIENERIADILMARARAIKQADPLKRPVFAHKSSPVYASAQDWTYARCQDFLGCSCYPAGGGKNSMDDGAKTPERHPALLREMWGNIAYRFDHVRSANRSGSPLWVAEFQGGPVNVGMHKGRVPSADDIRRWMLTAVSAGANALCFWVTRAEIMAHEANGYGLLDSVGDSNERFDEAGRVGRALNRYPNLFAPGTLEPASVGILVSEVNYQLCAAMNVGGLGYSTRGWHRLLWEEGLTVDFVDLARLDADSCACRLLVLPFPLGLSETDAERLSAFVRRGGQLICEAAPGRIDQHGFCTRGEMSPTMARLFGVSQQGFTMVREPDDGARWTPPERTWGEQVDSCMLEGCGPLDGQRIRPHFYVQTMTCSGGGEPCLRHGNDVAGVCRDEGAGRAWLLGTYAGFGGTAYVDSESRRCIHAILSRCGVLKKQPGGLLLRKRRGAGKEAWIFTNIAESTKHVDVDLEGRADVNDLLDGLFERRNGRVSFDIESLDIRVFVLE